MTITSKTRAGLATVALAAICGAGWWTTSARASDHDEAPLVKQDAAQDLTDVYVFESAAGKTTIIVCWAGFNDSLNQPTNTALYHPDALYTIHVDNDGDNQPDHSIRWRYGVNDQDQWGVRWEDVPGANGDVVGPVESIFNAGSSARVWTGHADDPFFFDVQGYLESIDTGFISFDNTRDFLSGLNVTAAAIEIDTDLLTGNNPTQIWATSARKN